MRLLVLGGTQFVGRALVEAALVAGDDVTLFHRGRTNPGLFPAATHVHGDRDGGLHTLAGGTWDACIDVSGYVPRLVRDAASILRGSIDRYVFVSTISVYADLSVSRDEHGPVATLEDPATEEIEAGTYGGLKALCEQAAAEVMGRAATIVRPGYVIGPHDHTGRFPWWAHHAAGGGPMLVPASLARAFQAIDSRDLAEFLLLACDAPLTGTFNATGPVPPVTLVDMLQEAARQNGTEIEVTVVDDAFLSEQGIEAELPLWVDDPTWAAWAEVDVSRAIAAGLRFRPIAETVAATLGQTTTVAGVGLTAEREVELLAAWQAREP